LIKSETCNYCSSSIHLLDRIDGGEKGIFPANQIDNTVTAQHLVVKAVRSAAGEPLGGDRLEKPNCDNLLILKPSFECK